MGRSICSLMWISMAMPTCHGTSLFRKSSIKSSPRPSNLSSIRKMKGPSRYKSKWKVVRWLWSINSSMNLIWLMGRGTVSGSPQPSSASQTSMSMLSARRRDPTPSKSSTLKCDQCGKQRWNLIKKARLSPQSRICKWVEALRIWDLLEHKEFSGSQHQMLTCIYTLRPRQLLGTGGEFQLQAFRCQESGTCKI